MGLMTSLFRGQVPGGGGPKSFTIEKYHEARSIEIRPPLHVDLSPDQGAVFKKVMEWIRNPTSKVLTLGGYAGTGKTTLVSLLALELSSKLNIAFCAYTGKAASVLREKLAKAGVENPNCGTIHGLIYQPVVDDKTGAVAEWKRRDSLDASLIVVDEASMIGRQIWDDLTSYGVKILAVGDHGQLPPVGDASINVVEKPELRLEKIHRQAEGNPILRLASHIRMGGLPGDFDEDGSDSRVQFVDDLSDIPVSTDPKVMLDMPVLCYTNRMRCHVNKLFRTRLRRDDVLAPKDIVICLKNTEGTIFNGMRGVVESVSEPEMGTIDAVVGFSADDIRLRGKLCSHQFGQEKTFATYGEIPSRPRNWREAGLLFDHGYAATVHKSQGSSYKTVIFLTDGRFETEDYQTRWLYTGVTRASEKIYLVNSR